jgi:hypothetical protein
MRIRVETESGSCHEVDTVAMTYRRLQLPVDPAPGSLRADLRRDGDTLRLLMVPTEPEIGKPWLLMLEPLNAAFRVTVRETTHVVAIEHMDGEVLE